MSASDIQEMRALLAAQTALAGEPRAPGFSRALKIWLTPRSAPKPAAPRPAGPTPFEETQATASSLPSGSEYAPIPFQGLMRDRPPRRPAFGQRTEPVLELREPAPAPAQRLTLTAPDGATVGEIILHGAELGAATVLPVRRRIEPQEFETPFFPEDLADEPKAYAPPPRRRAPAAVAPPSGPEMAATFLLATLAARLASEEAALNRRRAAAVACSKAA